MWIRLAELVCVQHAWLSSVYPRQQLSWPQTLYLSASVALCSQHDVRSSFRGTQKPLLSCPPAPWVPWLRYAAQTQP